MRRGVAMTWFCIRAFWFVLRTSSRRTPVFVVTTPFMLPYFTVLAATLRGARSALIVYDLYPEALVAAGLITDSSFVARAIKRINTWLFGSLSVAVVIGHDMGKSILNYPGMTADKVRYIPNWATLAAHTRPINPANPFRANSKDKIIVGMSGNLGFTHDPETVFAAAQRLAGDDRIVFMLSGWGVGWERLTALQKLTQLPNVQVVERVPEEQLEDFLTAADLWIIPYRRNMAGISVPSRLGNLLAIGRPILALSERDAEYAHLLEECDAGWIVEPENADALAATIGHIASDTNSTLRKGENALRLTQRQFSADAAGCAYRELARELRKLAH